MSIQFSDTSGKSGIIQLIERNCGFDDAAISGNTTLLAQFTGDVNIAMDKVWSIVFQAAGLWTLDDSNQTDYPIITTNLVSGQRDYSFTTDGSGNIILQIYRVLVADPSGKYSEIYPVNQQTTTSKRGNPEDTGSFLDGKNASGTPTRYDKTGNGIFLDVIPNYNSTNGLKVLINREATRFAVGDTTKKAGFAGIYHEYLALRPSYMYAFRKSLSNLASLEKEMMKMEREIENYYSKRDRDMPKRMIANVENTH